jgi:hypothetical protein
VPLLWTSARDILLDVFASSPRGVRFTSGLFVLCRYSLQPFAAGMLASGIRGCMFHFKQGDCQDYRTWLLADRRIKSEQTEILGSTRAAIRAILMSASEGPRPAARFRKRGNIFFAG